MLKTGNATSHSFRIINSNLTQKNCPLAMAGDLRTGSGPCIQCIHGVSGCTIAPEHIQSIVYVLCGCTTPTYFLENPVRILYTTRWNLDTSSQNLDTHLDNLSILDTNFDNLSILDISRFWIQYLDFKKVWASPGPPRARPGGGCARYRWPRAALWVPLQPPRPFLRESGGRSVRQRRWY